VDNYVLEDNVACEKGPFLVGGGRPSHGIAVRRNYLYGVDMRIGYGAENEDCEVRGNVMARGKLFIEKYKTVLKENNVEGVPDKLAVLIPNKYDPCRAHLVLYRGAGDERLNVRAAPFLQPGDAYRLFSWKDPFGKPVFDGKCEGPEILVPMRGEFAALLMLKEPGARP